MATKRGEIMIDENKLIDVLREIRNKRVDDKREYELMSDFINIVDNQPKVNEWIPVKDRLPEEHDTIFAKLKGTSEWNNAMFEKVSDDVNVTVEFENGKRKTMTMHTTNGKWRDDYSLTKKNVIAWQPLPSKYEG